MPVQILWFVLDVFVSLVAGASLLRMYMQAQRVPFSNHVGQLVFALTDWIVVPLRKLMSPKGRWDWSSFVAASLVVGVQMCLGVALGITPISILAVLWLTLCALARIALYGMMALLIFNAVLSWVQPHSMLYTMVQRLTEPLLRPVRKVLPLVGGIDFSILIVMVLAQVLLMVLGNVTMNGLRVVMGLGL